MDTIPAFCKIGDKGAHKDAVADMVYDDDSVAGNVVLNMIRFIEDMFDDWYKKREGESVSYGALSEMGKDIVDAEKGAQEVI
jgi:hypothetical protein